MVTPWDVHQGRFRPEDEVWPFWRVSESAASGSAVHTRFAGSRVHRTNPGRHNPVVGIMSGHGAAPHVAEGGLPGVSEKRLLGIDPRFRVPRVTPPLRPIDSQETCSVVARW